MNYFHKSGMTGVPRTMLGVTGDLYQKPGLNGHWEQQTFLAQREFKGQGGVFDICIRYERGHPSNTGNTFTIVKNFDGVTGPLNEDEAKQFWPELAHLVNWHLCNEGVPMHYKENSLYHGALGDAESARRCAKWPEAPDHLVLGAPNKFERELIQRLPALQARFFADLEATGMKAYPPEAK